MQIRMPKFSLPGGSCREIELLQKLSSAQFVPSAAHETCFRAIEIIMYDRNECFLYIDNTHVHHRGLQGLRAEQALPVMLSSQEGSL